MGGEFPNATVSGRDTTVGVMLSEFCTQEPRSRVVEPADPRVLNVLAVDENTPTKQILSFRLSKVDIETDDAPYKIAMDFVYYAPELQPFLAKLYRASGGRDFGEGSGGSLMGSDKSPHFSLHLKNVTVREALNAIGVRSLDIFKEIGIDPQTVSTPKELLTTATGWKVSFGNPREIHSLDSWSRSIFTFFQ